MTHEEYLEIKAPLKEQLIGVIKSVMSAMGDNLKGVSWFSVKAEEWNTGAEAD